MANVLLKQSAKLLPRSISSKMDISIYTALKPSLVGNISIFKQPATGGSGGTLKVIPPTTRNIVLGLSAVDANGYNLSSGVYLPHCEVDFQALVDASKANLAADYVTTTQSPTSVTIKDKTILK